MGMAKLIMLEVRKILYDHFIDNVWPQLIFFLMKGQIASVDPSYIKHTMQFLPNH